MITAAEVGGVDQSGAGGIELRDKGVAATTTAERWLEGAQGRREIGGTGGPADVGVPGSIHGNGDTIVISTAAQVGGVDQSGAGGIELRDEGVTDIAEAPATSRLEGPRGRRELGRVGRANHVGVAGGVHGDAPTEVIPTGAKVGGVEEHRVNVQ